MEYEEATREDEQPEPTYHTWDAWNEIGFTMGDFV